MTDLEWREPPSNPRANRPKYGEIIEQLRARPGQWALIETSQNARIYQKAHHLNSRYSIEARGVRESGVYNLYARWPEEKS